MTDNNRLYTGAALGLVAAATLGFGVARCTQVDVPTAAAPEAATPAKPSGASDTVMITEQGLVTSQVGVAPAASGELDAAIPAAATVEATPDAEAVLTAQAPGTVTRIFKRIGDPVRAGETLALVQSRDAAAFVADSDAARARVRLALRQLARERILNREGVSPLSDVETAQANLDVASADARRASAAMVATNVTNMQGSMAVVAPFAGRLTSASASLGKFVAAETELFRVADPRKLQITANVPPADASRIRTGDKVELTSSDGRTVEGRVRSDTGVVDPVTRAATVVVIPTAGGNTLIPGQLVQARIFASGGATRNGVMVPQDAVQTLGDRTVVFVRTRTGFRAQTVQVGSRSGGLVSITSGLAAGTRIATANAFLLKGEIEKESAE